MFRDKRSFRFICFRAPTVRVVEDILAFLPPGSEIADQFIPETSSDLRIRHCFYFSPEQFSSRLVPEQYQRKKGKALLYRYNMYLIAVALKQSPINLLAVPFLPMALDIYPHLRDGSRGKGFLYQSFKLPKLIAGLQNNKDLEGALKVSRIKYTFSADSLVDSIVFRGKDLAHSPIHSLAVDAIGESGSTLRPEQVRLIFGSKSERFTIEVDKSGHGKFWVARDASNLSSILPVVRYLTDQHLVLESASFPHIQSLHQEEEQEDHE